MKHTRNGKMYLQWLTQWSGTGHQLKSSSLLWKTLKLSKMINSFTEGIQKNFNY